MSQPYPTQQPTRRWWTVYAACTLLATVAAFPAGSALHSALRDDEPSVTACRTALQRQFDTVASTGTKADGPPAECIGVDQATLQRLAGELTAKELGEALTDAATATPAP